MQSPNDQLAYWNSIYNNHMLEFPQDDEFLSTWLESLRKAKRIVDLGCGNGVNSFYLYERGIHTIACDFSEPALNLLLKKAPDANVLLFDMRDGLPFLSNHLDVVIADLSLHYFSIQETKAILNEIRRSLVPDGMFICRVNAIETDLMGLKYPEIEKDYYDVNGCKKRFFTVDSLASIMSGFSVKKLYEQETEKYRRAKKTVVCEAYKTLE